MLKLFQGRGAQAPPRCYETPTGTQYTLYSDMLKQPHLLIAGATGSGKSVVINGLMYTALYKPPGAGPGAVNFILIDPKRVELVQYRTLPHVLYYASDPGNFPAALRYAMQLCESRYISMQAKQARRYQGGDVYIVIDEFADLILTNRKEIAPLIQRLAQIGRAALIHVVLATQTPIIKVLPTEIKCNFDARVGLRTRSAQDSRNIIGAAGLEKLPRYGEGVYLTPEGDARVKIPMYSDEEIAARVAWWTRQN